MSKIKQWSLKTKIFACLGVVLLGIIGLWGYNYYMEQQKVNNLYKRGFRLLEEQTALYIKENYSGVSKIEFSPIFIDGNGRFTMRTVNVVPVVYDEQGNRALLGTKVGNTSYGGYGINGGLVVDFDIEEKEMIYLEDFDRGIEHDVSSYDYLPKEAKLLSSEKIDDNILALIENNQLKLEKSSKGSPEATIVYNLDIEKGEHWEWQ